MAPAVTARRRRWRWLDIGAAVVLLAGFVAIWLIGPAWAGVQLQFAGSYDRATYVLDRLSASARRGLQRGLFVDFVVIASYLFIFLRVALAAPAIAKAAPEPLSEMATAEAREGRRKRIEALSRAFVLLAVTTALFDATENTVLYFAVRGAAEGDLPYALASAAAWPKWVLLGFLIGFTVWVVMLRRRRALRILTEVSPAGAAPEAQGVAVSSTAGPEVGVCCSGGGIRSAAYSLGALQALQQQPGWAKVGVIAAVSGGSYIAGARQILVTESEKPPTVPFARLSPEEQHLRNRTHYLAPGLQGKARAVNRWFRGFLSNVVFLAAVVWVLGRPLGWFVGSWSLYPSLRAGEAPAVRSSTWISLFGLYALALVVASLPLWRRFKKDESRNACFRYADIVLYTLGVIFVLQLAVPFVLVASREIVESIGETAAFVVGSVGLLVTGLAAARSIVYPYVGRAARTLAGLVVPLALAFSWLIIANGGTSIALGWGWEAIVTLAAVAVAIWLGSRDATLWSVRPFYMRRLADAYSLKLDDNAEVVTVPVAELKPLSQTGATAQPDLVICAAANVSKGAITPPGRNALSFTFEPTRVGMPNPRAGAQWGCATADIERALGGDRAENMTIISSVATSGAAFSPAMGRMTVRSLRMLLAVLNLRLGAWLPNPLWVNAEVRTDREAKESGVPRILPYFFKELLGAHRLDDRFLYVTDGGHWDNLGLVELLRRRCRVIFCFDAGGDQVTTFNAIAEAMSLARTDLGVEIDLRPDTLAPRRRPKRGRPTMSPRAFTIGTVRYPESSGAAHLVYCKAAVTESAPWEVRAYQQRNTVFPNHSTLFQLFDDECFEAYRALGEHTAASAYRAAAQRGIIVGTDR